ncbi:MAG: hypothetical protein QXL51_04105 [Candidatus Aenigmatarchaeota archaeon]
MKIKDEKLIGYVLLAIGLILIFFSIFSVFSVFTGSSSAPSLIKMNDVKISIPGVGETTIFDGETLSSITNIFLWLILMIFIASGGSRIGNLGVKLLKEIKVEIKKED